MDMILPDFFTSVNIQYLLQLSISLDQVTKISDDEIILKIYIPWE
jgi:hypothetical protein